MEHTVRLIISLLALLSLTLGGCSDYKLAKVAGQRGPDGSAISGLAQNPSPSGANGANLPSPWAALVAGELPEEYFAVAWSDPRDLTMNCYGPCPGIPRYDIIDVTGQVVRSFESPCSSMWAQHDSLQAAGPGRFLAVTSGQAPDSSYSQHAWIGDGISGETETVMQWGWGPKVYLPIAGREVELPGLINRARVLVDPHNEDRLYVLIDNTMMYAQPLLGTLFSVDFRDPLGEVRMWAGPSMIAPDLVPEWGHAPWDPWLVESFQRGDATMIVLGLQMPDEFGDLRTVLTGFSPQTGPLDWSMDLTGLVQPSELKLVPPTTTSDARVIFHQGPDRWCPAASFTQFDGGQIRSSLGDEAVFCSQLGPILDDSAQTFIYFGFSEAAELEREQRMFVHHRGVDVWELSEFREGLQRLPFEIHGMTRMELPKE